MWPFIAQPTDGPAVQLLDIPPPQYRVPTPPGKSWIFFLEKSRTWKVLENHFGPGKS